MRYYAPRLGYGPTQPRQRELQDKFGGLPWGFPPSRWPRCLACGQAQTPLAQLVHHPARLDLGREGRVLHVFQCEQNPGRCPTWEGSSGIGANACLILEEAELGRGPTPPPSPVTTLLPEARVTLWIALDDGVAPEDAAKFYEDGVKIPEDVVERLSSGTKLGSVPWLLGRRSDAPRAPWRFVAQFGNRHWFDGPLPAAEAPRTTTEQKGGWTCEWASFGAEGAGYVFVRTDITPPQGWFLWQEE